MDTGQKAYSGWSRSATFSDCRRYRYLLSRERVSGSGTCVFIMLNPSTADAMRDDPTIRRCMGFAARWGYRRLEVVNLFAFRSTDPSALVKQADPCGPGNNARIEEAIRRSDMTVAAWGDHGKIHARSASIIEMAARTGVQLWALGRNRSGEPTHPLYVPAAQEPSKLIVMTNMLG